MYLRVPRVALAGLDSPCRRRIVISMLRREAVTRGGLHSRIWLPPSRQITSRRHCKPFSIPQCPRMSVPMRSGFPAAGVREVTIWTVSVDHFRIPMVRDLQVKCAAWAAWGEFDPSSQAYALDGPFSLAPIGGCTDLVPCPDLLPRQRT